MPKARSLLSETESLATLVHGIFAITMTLLILELQVPDGDGPLLHRLGEQVPQFLAYVYGFAYLAVNWLTVREWFHLMRGIDRAQTMVLLTFVALLSLTPFTVGLVADAVHNTDELGTAVRVMSAVVGAAYLLSAVLTVQWKRRGNVASNQVATTMRLPVLFALACGPAVLAFALSYATPWLGIAVLTVEIVVSLGTGWEREEANEVESATV